LGFTVVADVLVVAALVNGFLVAVAFLRDDRVVRRFTAMLDADAVTGFLVVVFITAVAFFDGFGDAVGRLVGFAADDDSAETDGRGGTGFLLAAALAFVGFGLAVAFCVVLRVSFLIDSWIDWNVVNLMLSVVLAGSSFMLMVLDTLRSTMLPRVVVEKPPTCTEYFSVVEVLRVVIGRFANVVDDETGVVGCNSKVLLS
jgi:hypothetical protein